MSPRWGFLHYNIMIFSPENEKETFHLKFGYTLKNLKNAECYVSYLLF